MQCSWIKQNKLLFLLTTFILFSFNSGVVVADDLDEVRELLRDGYYLPVSEEILNKPSIDEIVAELDPYTEFFTLEEFNEFRNTIDMNYVGIGIIGEENPRGVRVDYLFEKGAAISSSLQIDDIIIEADGTSLEGLALEDSQMYLLGNEGTAVKLKVFRPSTNETFYESIIRATTEYAPTVDSAELAGNIGYLGLHSFNEESVDELKAAITTLDDVEGWIFDLRFNGGGYLDTAQDVAGLFPAVDTTIVIEGKDQKKIAYTAMKQSPQLLEPVFLLINEESASAAEILAGAVKDHGAGTLYGQTTFGKGVAQSVYELESGNLFKMTVAQFYTPNGDPINEIGIQPDVETELGVELQVAHRDLILQDENIEKIENEKFAQFLARNPVFTLDLQSPLREGELEKRITLYQLGGQEIDIDVKPTSLTTYEIRPSETLDYYSAYLLKVQTGIKAYVIEFETSDKIDENNGNLTDFVDVKDDAFFANSIAALTNEGYIKGIGNEQFGPYHYVTREQAAALFTRIFNLNTSNVSNPGFADVDEDDYFYTSVAAVKEAGIMSGKSKDRFGTGDILTRQEMAALLARAFDLQVEEGKMPFSDIGRSPFSTDILKVYQSGIAKGVTETTFSPNKGVTRGEFAIFLYRALVHTQSNGMIVVESIN
ncbi:S41 family peptidase [Bacillus sp. Marseille-P3661]|uniref:S41 family peptidase n=1 Tax=Bacillus sp. Marseille-P3661 TaxID=1936234 RepID=UPI0015E18A16|nr:S41 family peptidase [Bacillus sp. Marseille-P3661]